jgi:hypothetical protein
VPSNVGVASLRLRLMPFSLCRLPSGATVLELGARPIGVDGIARLRTGFGCRRYADRRNVWPRALRDAEKEGRYSRTSIDVMGNLSIGRV